jgi:hypothetical protein
MKDEALKLALEALKELVAQTEARLFAVKHDHVALQNARKTITAIKQALAAQPAQAQGPYSAPVKELWSVAPKAAAQRQWVNLTVDELITLEQKHMRHEDLSQAIEAKLKEKNAAAQPAVPDALNPKDENPAYAAGWNDCRAEMLKGMK